MVQSVESPTLDFGSLDSKVLGPSPASASLLGILSFCPSAPPPFTCSFSSSLSLSLSQIKKIKIKNVVVLNLGSSSLFSTFANPLFLKTVPPTMISP